MSAAASRVVRSYGRGSFLGLLSPLLAAFLASSGMQGWDDAARRAMEDDAADMARRGYRVATPERYAIPALGIGFYRVVYERDAVDRGLTRAD